MLPGLSSPETIRQRQSGPAGQRYEREAAIAKPKIQNYCSGCSLRRTCERTFGREQRAFAGRSCGFSEAANSAFKIQDYEFGLQPADGPATIRSSPPPGGGCGLPVAPRPIWTQDTPQTKSGCGILVLTDPICSKTRPNRIVSQYKIVHRPAIGRPQPGAAETRHSHPLVPFLRSLQPD